LKFNNLLLVKKGTNPLRDQQKNATLIIGSKYLGTVSKGIVDLVSRSSQATVAEH
jgi:hypothetical protein